MRPEQINHTANGLPKDWKWVKLGEICEKVYVAKRKEQEPKSKFLYLDIGGIDNQTNKIVSHKEYQWKDAPSRAQQIIQKNDILFSTVRTYLKNIALVESHTYNNQIASSGFSVIRGKEELSDPKFLFYYSVSQNFLQPLNELQTGSSYPAVRDKDVFSQIVPLPPLSIQQAIVSKIEELFSELDKGIEQLKTAQRQLKVYRQAVLKWAFEGRLTNENVKDGELPKSWNWTKLGEHIEKIEAGKSFKCDEREPKPNEIGVLKVSAVSWGEFDEAESKTVIEKSRIIDSYFVKKGDFLFSRANTIELVGATVIVKHISKKLMLSDKTLRVIYKDSINPFYALYYLRCKKGRNEIEKLSTGNQESMRNIGQERIKQIKIPYCSSAEQEKVIQEIETRLSVADKLEETIINSLQQAEALRQSILKQAFEGKLV
jgi:type I restriction enzyme S subunit